MERSECVQRLIGMLLSRMPEYRAEAERFPKEDATAQRRLLRSLMNLWPNLPLSDEYLKLQDELLSAEREERGVVNVSELSRLPGESIALWRGDITRLDADAIVNAANSALLGCFCPCHGCIDNAIHSAAGLQLRAECGRIMERQGHEEPPGGAKLTGAYNLPSRYVIHTVGPIVIGPLRQTDRELLAACYRSCLALAMERGLQSIAFCCISTGEFHFPGREAAEIAVSTVRECLSADKSRIQVILNVFKESDEAIYRRLLRAG